MPNSFWAHDLLWGSMNRYASFLLVRNSFQSSKNMKQAAASTSLIPQVMEMDKNH